jgi:choline-sulfatase
MKFSFRLSLVWLLSLLVVLNMMAVSVAPDDSISPPPNFIFIIADDMDTYAVNAYRKSEPAETAADGQPYAVDTPHIDSLAAEGMMFHQTHLMGSNSGAVCMPSRTCIMSGKNMWQRTQNMTAALTFPGVFNRGVRSDGAALLPYATYRTCKVGNSYPTANAEFTVVNDATKRGNTDGNGSEWHADQALSYLEDWSKKHKPSGKPFFIYLGFSHPHDVRLAREQPDLTGRYQCVNTADPGTIVLNALAPPLPLNYLSCTPDTYPAHPFDHGGLTIRDEVKVAGVMKYRTEAVIRNEIGRNFACTDWIDQQVGRVLARLRDPNGDGDTSDSVVDNTYVVFTADHGIAIGRHGLQGKQNLYEHTWKVPYIVRGPGIKAGSESQALIYLHDTFPTFCDLAGLEIPATIDANDGQSFKAVLEDSSRSHRDVLYGVYAGSSKPGIRAVTDGRYKLIKYDVANNAVQMTQLFDLQKNPFELLPEHGVPNLAYQSSHAAVRQRLEEQLLRKRVEFADPYQFLGDRTLLRFEDGKAGSEAHTLQDYCAQGNDALAGSGRMDSLPLFSADIPDRQDFVYGSENKLSLAFERSKQHYLRIDNQRGLDFGAAPFTIELWVRFAVMPAGNEIACSMPVVQKKVIGAGDSKLDYMLLAAAGSYGGEDNFDKLMLHFGSGSVVSSLAVPDTNWHFISVAFDPVTKKARFTMDDQIDIHEDVDLHGIVNDGPLIVGAHFNMAGKVDRVFDGLIDELSISDGYLAELELQPLRFSKQPTTPRGAVPQLSARHLAENSGGAKYQP